MDGGHCLDLLDLRFQRNAVLRLLICTDSDVTDRFCCHILKKLDHMRGGSHKLSGYRFRPTSVRGNRPTRTGPRQCPASTRTTATDFRRGLRKTVADGARPVALVAGAVLLSCFRVLADSVVGRVVAGNAQAKMPSGSLQDISRFRGKPFLGKALHVVPGMT